MIRITAMFRPFFRTLSYAFIIVALFAAGSFSQQQRLFSLHREHGVSRVAFSPDNQRMLVLAAFGFVYNVETGEYEQMFRGNFSYLSATFSHDGQYAAFGVGSMGIKNEVDIYHLASGEHVKRIVVESENAFNSGVNRVAFTLDDKQILINYGTALCLWDLQSDQLVWRDKGVSLVRDIQVLDDERVFVAGGNALVLSLKTGEAIHSIVGFANMHHLTQDKQYIYTMMDDDPSFIGGEAAVRIYDTRSGARIRSLTEPIKYRERFIKFLPSGDMMFNIDQSNVADSLNIRSTEYRADIRSLRLNNSNLTINHIYGITYSPDGTRAAILAGDDSIPFVAYVYDISDLVADIPDSALHDD